MHTKFKRAIFLILTVALLATAGGMMDPIQRQREKYKLGSTPVKGVSPELAIATQALGAFRGIMLDLVWIRLQHLKREGRFFEMVQLSDWACKLAPRFPKIWQFHSWNLGYNVSVEISYLPDRWSWVKSSIEILRDEAIPKNPDNPELYNALAQLYLVKVAGRKDDAHIIYKSELGARMHEVLDGRGKPEKLKEFAAAPRTEKELMQDSSVKKLVEECRSQEFDPLSTDNYFGWLNNPDSIDEEISDLLGSESYAQAMTKIDTFVRARRLREEMKLEPDRMLKMMRSYSGDEREYVPFDWRSPYPHSIYWATRARDKAHEVLSALFEKRQEFGITPEELTKKLEDRPEWIYRDIDYDRIIYSSFKDLIRHGRLVFSSDGRLLPVFGPNYKFADAMMGIYEMMLDKYGGSLFADGIHSSRKNFLHRMAVESYMMGDQGNAVSYWKKLKKMYPEASPQDAFPQFISVAMDQWVKDMDQSDARRLVRGLLTRSFVMWGSNANERAAQLQAKAQRLTKEWNKGADTARWRIPYNDIRESILIDIFSGRIKLADPIMKNLKDHLGEQTVQKFEGAAKQQPRQMIPPQLQDRFKYAPQDE